jgi:hypothetical protein
MSTRPNETRSATKPTLAVKLEHDTVQIGDLRVTFHRTLRIPDDGRRYPLPPSLGHFPVCRVEDYADRVPASWLEHGGVFLPMYQREAMWLSFDSARSWRPQALKVAVGMVNAVSGEPWSQQIDEEQDYLVCPPQPWLDGIKSEDGIIRQFVAMPLGMGYTVEGQLTGEERFGGSQLIAFDPKDGVFTEQPEHFGVRRLMVGQSIDHDEPFVGETPETDSYGLLPAPLGKSVLRQGRPNRRRLASAGAEMGLGAGGRMEQQVYPDPYGAQTWDTERFGRVYVHIVNSQLFEDITGRQPPASPISAQTYAEHGYPWFDLYDEHLGDVPASDILASVKSVSELDSDKGFQPQQDDTTVAIPEADVVKYPVAKPTPTNVVRDGDWPK